MKLGNLVEIRSGLVLRRKQERGTAQRVYRVLTLRSIMDDGSIDESRVEETALAEKLNAEYVTRAGDIVMRLTAPYAAVLIDEASAGMVVPSNFAILRTKGERILPAYLHWLLNTQDVRRTLYMDATSNMLAAIRKQTLEQIEVKLPGIAKQRAMGELNRLAMKERRLLGELAAQKERYSAMVLKKAYDEIRR